MKNLKNLTKVQLIEQLQKQKDENNKDSVNQNKAVETKQNFNMNNIIKLRKIRRTNVWNTIVFNTYNRVFTNNLFEKFLDQFWNKIESKFSDNNHLFILLKIKYINNDYATIGNLQRLNLGDKIWYLNVILELMDFKSDYYKETQIDSLIFSYGFKSGQAPIKSNLINNLNFQIYKDNKLPISINIFDYGTLITSSRIENGTKYIFQNNKAEIIVIDKYDNNYNIEIFRNRVSLIKYTDNIISENNFVRTIKNNKFYFENNKEILFLKEIKTKFISKLTKSKNLTNNFITLDIETYVKDNILVPFCISIYDGRKTSSFFIKDYKNVEDMIISSLKSIMIRKYNGYNIYLHNMAKFDIIFLFKYLAKLGALNPVIHNDRIISIDFNFGKNNEYQLKFRDSYLILLNSLMKLSKAFNVVNKKSLFPIFFVNENNLDFLGDVPDIKYFNKITLKEYNLYKANFNGNWNNWNNWNLKNETIKYCNTDCISLYQILFKFNNLIFDLFGKNIHHYPTLPSLHFAIFRSNFMSEENIPQLSGKIASDIREGYTGGAVDMYIPESKPGVKIKCYDINSLYPSRI
jgi:DNA polymerase family B